MSEPADGKSAMIPLLGLNAGVFEGKSTLQSRYWLFLRYVSSDCFNKLIILIGIFRGKFETGA